MAQEIINVGTNPNDGTGDTLRDAFIKTDDNFTDLYTNKQDTLVSGTNIKTINSTPLLGSGDVSVQETLVSGTNIKTINGNSLLGSGDVIISGGITGSGTDNYIPRFNGTTALEDSIIYDNGTNVGIGNSSPTNKFIVDTNVNGADGMVVRNLSTESSAYTFIGAFNNTGGIELRSHPSTNSNWPLTNWLNSSSGMTNGLIINQAGASPITIFVNGYERMRITPVGNVGIGISDPTEKLDVNGNIMLQGDGSGYAFVNSLIGSMVSANLNSFDFSFANGSIVSNPLIGTNTFYTNGSERMLINSAGNVGIGTSTPDSLLAVGGSGESAVFSVSGVSGINTIATFRDIEGENVFLTGGKLSDNSIDIAFGDVNSAYGLPYYKINSNYHSFMDGNVGVGTDTPGAKLDVIGDFIVTDSTSYLQVDSAGINAQGYDVTGQNSGLALQDSVAQIGLDLGNSFVGLNVQTGLGAWLENENTYKFGIATTLNELTSSGLVQNVDTPSNGSRVEGWIKIYDENIGQMYFMPVYL